VAGINHQKGLIIIDSPSYQGNSGGPVVEIDHSQFNITRFLIIGIVSQFMPFQEIWENKTLHYGHVLESNSGYTIIEPMDAVFALVWK